MPDFHDRRTGQVTNPAKYVQGLVSDIHSALEHPHTSTGPGPSSMGGQGNLKEPLKFPDAPHTKMAVRKKASAKQRSK